MMIRERPWEQWHTKQDGVAVADVVLQHLLTPQQRREQWRDIRWLPGEPGETVLDVPCANANYLPFFTEDRGMVYTGLDYCEAMIEAARAEYPEADLLIGDAAALPVGHAEYDLVFCADLLLHMPEEYDSIVLGELLRAARKYVAVHWRVVTEPPAASRTDRWGCIYRWPPNDQHIRRMDAHLREVAGGLSWEWHTRGPRRIGQRAGEDIYLVVAK